MTSKMCYLRLISPAFSNREIEQIKDNDEYIKYFKKSNLYMIVQRKEIIFSDYSNNEETNCLHFTMSLKNSNIKSNGYIKIDEFFNTKFAYPLTIEAGEKGFTLKDSNEHQVLTEYIWYFKARDKKGLYGFDNYRDFTHFHLHYIGISKDRNSFTRLVEEPHDKRLRILLQEEPYNNNSQLKDELYLLFFDIVDMNFAVIENYDEIDNITKETDKRKIIADAEKAFVKFLQCDYNEVLYENYPFGKDGLYTEKLNSYLYQIQEDITLNSNKSSFIGRFGVSNANFADLIYIKENNATLYKAKDFE